jgi:LacI family transcriptional regulator
MTDVAQAAEVSQATVSLVLNDVDGSGISQSTRDRVRSVAREMGYRHNALARSLKLQRSDTIGFVSDRITTGPYAHGLVRGAHDALRRSGKHLLISNVEYGDGQTREEASDHAVIELLERRVDGIIFASVLPDSVEVPPALSEIPSVLLDVVAVDQSLASIVPDEFSAAKAACGLLIDAGHTNIVHLTPSKIVPSVLRRRAGFVAAMSAAGIGDPESAVFEIHNSTPSACEAAIEILSSSSRPTAFFCYNDEMAWGVFQAAAALGCSIPRGLSVVGFKNVPLIAPMLRPGLTTVELPHYEMAEWAVAYLLDGRSDTEQRMVDCPMVVRDSVGPPARTRMRRRRSRSMR